MLSKDSKSLGVFPRFRLNLSFWSLNLESFKDLTFSLRAIRFTFEVSLINEICSVGRPAIKNKLLQLSIINRLLNQLNLKLNL